VANCPACGRAVALSRAHCLYCGAPLGSAAGERPEAATTPAAAEPSPRVLVLLDLSRNDPLTLVPALAVSRYEAALLARRGGIHLVRASAPADAEAEAERLRSLGAQPILVPEAEVRAQPVACLKGERDGSGLRLRSAQGSVAVAPGDVFLVVSGPIRRERQARAERRKFSTAGLDEGFRVHLHRPAASPPLEIDALNFEVGFAPSGSVRLELESWLEAATRGARRDTGFGRLPPVLGPAEPEPAGGLLSAASSLAASARADADERALVLDNLAQFRFYSGCLAAVERRR
jgi:hypothetical protein